MMDQQTFGRVSHEAALANCTLFRTYLPEWLASPVNFIVWSSFVYQANLAWDKGYRHYSARTIGESLRHHTAMSDTSTDFKLNDWIWPDLARLYMLVYPERKGFFETRGRAAA